MIENIEYTQETGNEFSHDLVVYALSTCGFCRRGLAFLRDHNIPFRFIYVDKLDYDLKQSIKLELKNKFGKSVAFPFLVIDDKDTLVGFIEEQWRETLGV